MAQKKKMGLVQRLIVGKEKSEGYARASLPSNRWELFWDILKGRLGKLFVINLLIVLFFIPLAALLGYRYIVLMNMGAQYPFAQAFGVGYGAPPALNGYAEGILFQVNLITFLLLPIVLMIAAIGIAGGAYVIRNMVWTEGIFVSNDFWRGIRQNIKQMLLIAVFYSLLFYMTTLSNSFCNMMIAQGADKKWLFVACQVISYVVIVFYSIMTMHMITMSVTYELKFTQLLRNSVFFTVGLMPQNIFFLAICAIPIVIFFIGSYGWIIAILILLTLGLSLILLVWTNFCQWSYDKFVNDKVPGAQKNRGIYEKVKESDSGALKKYREQLAIASRSSLNSRPIKPITDDELTVAELPTSFNRADIEKLNASKQAIYEDHLKYVEEHKNDPEFQKTEEEMNFEKQQEERQKRIEKAKKELAKRKK